MQITSVRPIINESSPPNPQTPVDTLSSMCSWGMTTKEETPQRLCHWFIPPHQKVINIRQNSSKSHFTPLGHLSNLEVHSMHNSPPNSSLSLILILGGVFLILLMAAIITCMKQKKEMQPLNEEGIMAARISNHVRRMNSSNSDSGLDASNHRDPPPDYDAAVKTKETETEELPSYSEAVFMEVCESGNTELADLNFRDQ